MARNGAPFSPRHERKLEMQRTRQLNSCQVITVQSGSFLPKSCFQRCLTGWSGEMPFCSCSGQGSVGSRGSWRNVFLFMPRAGLSGEWGLAGVERTLGGQGQCWLPPATHGPPPANPWGLTFVLRCGPGRDATV